MTDDGLAVKTEQELGPSHPPRETRGQHDRCRHPRPQRKGPAESSRGARAVRLRSLLGGCLDGPLAEYLEEVLLVLLRALEVGLHVNTVGALLRRGLNRCRVGRL